MDLLVSQYDLTFQKINGQILGMIGLLVQVRIVIQLVAVPKGGAEPCQKLRNPEGLGEVIVGAKIQGANLVLLLGAGGHYNDGVAGPGANTLNDLTAVHIRKTKIQQDNVRADGCDQGERFFPCGGGCYFVIVSSQGLYDKVQDVFFVFNHQYTEFVVHDNPPSVR